MTRRGHSLVELLVALVVGAVVMGAAANAARHAFRTTADALRRQAAVAATAAVLDSILAAPAPVAGERQADGLLTVWRAIPEHRGIAVEVRSVATTGEGEIARLTGFWAPAPPWLAFDPSAAEPNP